MIDETLRAFLQKPLTARMSTVDEQGYPHTVPVWFMLDGNDLVVMGERRTRKVKHMQANPKGSINIGGDTGDGAGYLFKGEWSIEEDPDDYWMKTITNRYESGEQAAKDIAEWTKLDIVAMRLKVKQASKV
jgi:general stress protein 26